MRRMLVMVTVVTLSALLGVACGSGTSGTSATETTSGSGSDGEVDRDEIEALLAAVMDLEDPDRDDTECVGEGLLEELGADGVAEAVEADGFRDLSRAGSATLVEVVLDCSERMAGEGFAHLLDQSTLFGFSADEADCLGEEFAEQLDAEQILVSLKLQELNRIPPSLIPHLISCADDAFEEAMAESLEDDGADADQAGCLAESYVAQLDEDQLADLLSPGDELPDELADLIDDIRQACDDPDSTGETPDTYGDDPGLDNLWDLCDEGNFGACDQLYWVSAIDSGYEAFGGSCGERGTFEDDRGLCVANFATTGAGAGSVATEIPFDLGEDEYLDGLSLACAEGDLVSCDDLYDGAEAETLWWEFGFTCGGRVPFEEVEGRYCVDIFGTDVLLGGE